MVDGVNETMQTLLQRNASARRLNRGEQSESTVPSHARDMMLLMMMMIMRDERPGTDRYRRGIAKKFAANGPTKTVWPFGMYVLY